jgi:hypothetical protein
MFPGSAGLSSFGAWSAPGGFFVSAGLLANCATAAVEKKKNNDAHKTVFISGFLCDGPTIVATNARQLPR